MGCEVVRVFSSRKGGSNSFETAARPVLLFNGGYEKSGGSDSRKLGGMGYLSSRITRSLVRFVEPSTLLGRISFLSRVESEIHEGQSTHHKNGEEEIFPITISIEVSHV